MSGVDGERTVEKNPFAGVGVEGLLSKNAEARRAVEATGLEMSARVQGFLQTKIGKCREKAGTWDLSGMEIGVSGGQVVISNIRYFQYGASSAAHSEGTHIISLLESAGFQVTRVSGQYRAGIVLTAPLAEFNELTAGEMEWGDGGCGVVPKEVTVPADAGTEDGGIRQAVQGGVGFVVAAARRETAGDDLGIIQV